MPFSLKSFSFSSRFGKLPYPISETYDGIFGTTFLPGVLAFRFLLLFSAAVLPIVKNPSNLLLVMLGPG